MIDAADIVCGLAWGDEAKGKITAWLASRNKYSYVCRWAGGSNAGHTIYIDGQKYATHIIPAGVFFGIPSIIGPGCVINERKFQIEMEYLEESGFDSSLVKVSPRAHVVTEEHILKDKRESAKRLGTTGSGIGPCYSDKARRIGVRADSILLRERLWDEQLSGEILCEGAQGIWLDLDWGNYPYVTSSTTLPYGACSLGFPTQKIRRIYGAAKIYDTRSGIDPEFPDTLLEDSVLARIGEVGAEYGVTTGRRRKVKWLDLPRLVHSINMTGSTHIIISKCDVLEDVGEFCLQEEGRVIEFRSLADMQLRIKRKILSQCPLVSKVVFSRSASTV